MKTLGEIVQHCSFQQNDQRPNREYSRWSRTIWVEYLNQALKEIMAYRPEAFTQWVEFPLVPGRVQTVPDGATIKGLEVKLPDGAAKPLPEADGGLSVAFNAYNCCVPAPVIVNSKIVYNMRGWAQDPSDPNKFYVSPPVPPGATVTVSANVDGALTEYTLENWDQQVYLLDKYYNNLIDYMIGRSYQLDSESAVGQRDAHKRFYSFYQAMGVKYKMDSARGSGYYEGQVGQGDSRSIVR